MAVTSYWYVNGLKSLVNGAITLGSSSFKVCLLGSDYALTNTKLQEDDTYADVIDSEITGTNYTAGGVGITLNAATNSTADVIIGAAVANTAWNSATFTARYTVIYESTGTNTDMYLMGIVDFGADQSCSNGSFTIGWDDIAIFKMTPSAIT